MCALIGIDPASIVSLEALPSVPDAPTRFIRAAQNWIEGHYGLDCFRWHEHWHYAPYALLAQIFTETELIHLWHGCLFASKLDDHFQEHEPLIWKIQLRAKHGNRFLYKLPIPYLDFALDLIHQAFPSDDLYLVTGTSTATAVQRAYGKEAARLQTSTLERITHFYDQPLSNYGRTGAPIQCSSDDGRAFVRLLRSTTQCRKVAA